MATRRLLGSLVATRRYVRAREALTALAAAGANLSGFIVLGSGQSRKLGSVARVR